MDNQTDFEMEYVAMDKTTLDKPKCRFKRNVIILTLIAIPCIYIAWLFIKESWTASLYAADYSWLNQFIK